DSLAAVLTREPDLERVPGKVRRLLRRCLEKDPKKRLRDIGEVWAWLEEEPIAPPAAGKTRFALLAWTGGAGALGGALIGVSLWCRPKTTESGATARFSAHPASGKRGTAIRQHTPSRALPGWTLRGVRREGHFIGKAEPVGAPAEFHFGAPARKDRGSKFPI